jgi:CO dehydrogenase maturation factor
MMILVSGKGGSGKSTLTALMARAFEKRDFRVLVLDMDESNHGLHRLMGLDRPMHLLDFFGGKKGLREKMKPALPGAAPGENLFEAEITLDTLSPDWTSHADGIFLLVIGKIHDFGEGCACPMGGLTRQFLSRLVLAKNDVAIIDTTAGVEHFGRGIDRFCDLIIGIVDPTYESLALADRMEFMARSAGTQIRFIFNKVDELSETLMEEHFRANGIMARIPHFAFLHRAGLEGKPITEDVEEIEPIVRYIETVQRQHRS